MPITVSCPCGANLRASDAAAGKRVKCPKCGSALVVPSADFEVVDHDPPPTPARKAAPVAKPKPQPTVADDEDERPRRKAGREDDEEGEKPKKKTRRDDGDDEGEDEKPNRKARRGHGGDEGGRPKKKGTKAKPKSHLLLLGVGGGLLALLAVGGGIVAAVTLGGGGGQAKGTVPGGLPGGPQPSSQLPKGWGTFTGNGFSVAVPDESLFREQRKRSQSFWPGLPETEHTLWASGQPLVGRQFLLFTVTAGALPPEAAGLDPGNQKGWDEFKQHTARDLGQTLVAETPITMDGVVGRQFRIEGKSPGVLRALAKGGRGYTWMVLSDRPVGPEDAAVKPFFDTFKVTAAGNTPAPPANPPGVAPPANPAPDFPLEPEPVYQDLPADFVTAVKAANGSPAFAERSAGGSLTFRFILNTTGSKVAIPLAQFRLSEGDPMPNFALPACPVPFGVNLNGPVAWTEAAVKPLASQQNLELLWVGDLQAGSVPALAGLATAPKLRRLVVRDKSASDADMATLIKSFPTLTEIDLEDCEKVGPNTLAAISDVKGLRQLNLGGNNLQLKDRDVARLAPLKELRQLCLRDSRKLGPAAVAVISTFDQLERLDLFRGPAVRDSGVEKLSRLTRLRYLAFGGGFAAATYRPTDADLQALAKLPHLADLGVDAAGMITPDGWKVLAGCKALKRLTVNLQDGKVGGLTIVTQVEELSIDNWPKSTPAETAALAALPNLKRLRVSGGKFGDADLVAFCGAGKLETLDVGGSEMSDAAFAKIADLKNLKRLSVGAFDCSCTDATLASLSAVNSLVELSFPRSKGYTAAGLKKLAALKNLRSLSVPGGSEDPEWEKATEELKKALPGCQFKTF